MSHPCRYDCVQHFTHKSNRSRHEAKFHKGEFISNESKSIELPLHFQQSLNVNQVDTEMYHKVLIKMDEAMKKIEKLEKAFA
jgi:hypothetical protein